MYMAKFSPHGETFTKTSTGILTLPKFSLTQTREKEQEFGHAQSC